jgi:serine/threonine protein kinase
MTQTASLQDHCSKCGKPKRQLKKMSLTQWMFSTDACNCDTPAVGYGANRSREFTSVLELCPDCGLPVLTGRPGSMTQWIFGATSCKCQAKLLRENQSASGRTIAPEFLDRETELLVDKFHVSDEVSALTVQLGLPEDRYQAVKLVGQGAVSKVYECQDRLLQRLVAIKFLIANKWTGEEIKRFQSEAKATSKLTHPNIVLLHDFGATSTGQPYMVLEYFTGVSLEDLIGTRGPLPEEVAVEIGSQIADAMQFAHTKGILHRDVKPANIMLIEEDPHSIVAKIIDFGIADFITDQSLSVKGGSIVGTPNYMSPDLLQGRKADARSDVYSLGCTLFEALTGRPPFIAESALEIVQMHVNEPPPALHEALPSGEFSEDMEALIEKALQKDPQDRFASMAELADALDRIKNGADSGDNADQGDRAGTTGGTSAGTTKKRLMIVGALVLCVVGAVALSLLHLKNSASPPVTKAKPLLPKTDELRWQSPFGPDIQENLMGDEALEQYQHLRAVDTISIRGANITDKGIEYIKNCNVRSLGLEGCKITNKGFKQILSIKTLRILNLSHCPQLTDYSYLALRPELTSVWFLNNELTDEQLKWFAPLKNLNAVNISDNPRITGTGFVHFQNMKELRDLRISGLQFTADGIKALSELTQLTSLNIRFSNIQDRDLEQIAKLENLRILSLIGTSISDKGLKQIAKLRHLKQLYIGTCKYVTPHGVTELSHKRRRLQIDTNHAYSL